MSETAHNEFSGKFLTFSYLGHSSTLEHPADRRRFAHWAKVRGVSLVNGNADSADVLVLTTAANFEASTKNFDGPVILDLVDGYFTYTPGIIEDVSRNVVRAIKGASSLKHIRYSNSLLSSIRKADAIVISSVEHLDFVSSHNTNIHVIEDNFSELIPAKSSVARIDSRYLTEMEHKGFSIIWEGLGVNLKHLCSLASELGPFLTSTDSILRIVTTPTFYQISNKFLQVNSRKLVEDSFGKASERISLVPWSVPNLVEATRMSDIAVIPINQSDMLGSSKPANKLLSFWTLGVPTLFSPISSYVRVATEAGLTKSLVQSGEWASVLDSTLSSQELLHEIVRLQNQYVAQRHNPDDNLEKWDNLLRSLIE